jgi:hypothetical protein
MESGLDVRWLSEQPAAGHVSAFVDGELVASVTTPEGQSHMALLDITSPTVEIEYGLEGGPRFRTTIVREPEPRPALEIDGVDSVYMLGDVHGEFDRLSSLLQGAGLADDSLRWTGGHRHLVLLGDLFDRGDDVTRVLWLLYRLEREAETAGGGVHVVLGNHEVMVMSADLRYVAAKEQLIAFRHGLAYSELFDPHESVLGRWLASRPALMKIDDLLLAHGGMSPRYLEYTLDEYQDSLQSFMSEDLFLHWNDAEYLAAFGDSTALDSAGLVRRWEFFFESSSVMWYRSLVLTDTLGEFLDTVLDRFDATVHVVGHTPVMSIRESYGGRLIAADLREAATEMLFLARRRDGGWNRLKIPLDGPPLPLTDTLVP